MSRRAGPERGGERGRSLRALRTQDAFFRYVQTPRAPQQIGAVIVLHGGGAARPELRLDALWSTFAGRLESLPLLRRTLVVRGGLLRPAWRTEVDVTPADHLGERWIEESGDAATVIDEFLAEQLPLSGPPWQLRLVHDAGGGDSLILAKVHHALGDGPAVLGTLIGLLADEDLARAQAAGAPVPGKRPDWHRRMRRYRKAARGLRSLAAAGKAPVLPAVPAPDAGAAAHSRVELPTAQVHASARAHRVNTSTFLLAVLAETLHRILPADTASARALVPKTTRGALPESGTPNAPGNWSAALTLDLPVGVMAPAVRLATIADRARTLERAGQPVATQVAMSAFGRLPAPLHAWTLRRLYGYRHFNLIVTVLPGPREHPHLVGTPARAIFPFLPLADGVGLGMCALRWVDVIGVGITTDQELLGDAEVFAACFRLAFDDLRAGP